MTEYDRTDGSSWEDGSTDDHEVEEELRTLLQLAAPYLPAPADRMERVFAIAARARRRRRRAALAAGLAVGLTAAVLAAAPALAPAPQGTVLRPAVSGPALAVPPDDPGKARPSASPTVPSGSGSTAARSVVFPQVSGLVADLPEGWSDLTGPADGMRTRGFVSPQPLTQGPDCPTELACPATGTLAEGNLILSFRFTGQAPLPGDAATAPEVPRFQEIGVDPACRMARGTRQLQAIWFLPADTQKRILVVSVCMRAPTERTFATLEDTAASLRLAGNVWYQPDTPATPSAPGSPAR
ncbi:hypothetical protein ACFCX4_19535 [Kitasatospora sp. NPDC056327]|uniref:hypothetical protein n=1 Tax=Kitasatospora sp. NPDC056327 TaxID=3345785 RepID=UPI0035DD33FA